MEETGRQKDYYSILGARSGAPREEIERRYKRLARRHHPDRGGDEEEMKALNEAWRVLGDEEARRSYDAGRARGARETYASHAPASSPGAKADPLSGRIVGAGICIFVGLVLLFLVRAHYVVFLWPLALLALALVFFGVWMAHAALAFAREGFAPSHLARRTAWAQEALFWAAVGGGACGVYLLLAAL